MSKDDIKKYFDELVIPFYNDPELFRPLVNARTPEQFKIFRKNGAYNRWGASLVKNKENCLEFGCGAGRWMRYFKKYFNHVDGCDISEAALEAAQNNLWDLDSNFYKVKYGSLADIPVDHYDFIYSITVFQHIPIYTLRKQYMKQLYHKLREGGRISIHMLGGEYRGNKKCSLYYDDCFDAKETNSGHDVTCEDVDFLVKDLQDCGFYNIDIDKRHKLENSSHEYHIIAKGQK
jgi:cyclopropane fatty-acyl-phospholipid synthase-like methyltransferase